MGGIKRISKVSEKVVSLMAGLYILAVMAVLALNLELLPGAISLIVKSAFNPRAAPGWY